MKEENKSTKKKVAKKTATKKKTVKKRAVAIAKPTTTIDRGSRFVKVEDDNTVTMRIKEERVSRPIVNGNVAYLPRKTKDRRMREWTSAEEQLVVKWYKQGKSRSAISRMLDISHAPLMRKMFELNCLTPRHVVAAYKAGYLKHHDFVK